MHSCQSQLGAAVGILIPSWKKPNFLKSALLRRRICQSWFYFCKDFPRDLGITLGHGLTSKCFSWFCFAQTNRATSTHQHIGRICDFENRSLSSLLQNRRHSFPSGDGGGREQSGSIDKSVHYGSIKSIRDLKYLKM